MRTFWLILLMADVPIWAEAQAQAGEGTDAGNAKKPCRVLLAGSKQVLNSDLATFLEAMIEHSHPDWDVRCHAEPGDGRQAARRENIAGAAELRAWVGHDKAGMTADVQARLRSVDGAIRQATPKDPAKRTPETEARLAALQATRAQWQGRLDEVTGQTGWDYVLLTTLTPPEFQAELLALAQGKKFKTYLILPFGNERHGNYYGNAHYMPIKGILPKDLAAAQTAQVPVVASAHAFGTLFQTTGESKGPYKFYYAAKFTWMGSYVVASAIHTTLFNTSPVGAWVPTALPESATKPPPEGGLPFKPEYITQFQEQVWKSHQAFAAVQAALGNGGKQP